MYQNNLDIIQIENHHISYTSTSNIPFLLKSRSCLINSSAIWRGVSSPIGLSRAKSSLNLWRRPKGGRVRSSSRLPQPISMLSKACIVRKGGGLSMTHVRERSSKVLSGAADARQGNSHGMGSVRASSALTCKESDLREERSLKSTMSPWPKWAS